MALNGWKCGEFQDVPEEIFKAQGHVKVEQKTVPVRNVKDTLKVFYQEAAPAGASKHPPLLLLHGMRFKSQTWADLGTLTFLGALGHRAVAVDLPGYGNTPALSSSSGQAEERVEFLTNFIQAVGLDRPVIVSPSLSGSFALPYLLQDPRSSGLLSSGYVPVAPIHTETFPPEAYKASRIPVAVVYGSEDTVMGEQSLVNLQNFARREIICYEGAGHPCYLDKPGEWHKTLYNFLRMIHVEQKTVTLKTEVFYQEVQPLDSEVKAPPVLLLHGMSFKSQTWNDLGTLTFLRGLGHRAVAIDLPGFGNTPRFKSGSGTHKENADFLRSFIEAVGLKKPVIISPSMSGSFALPYLLEHPAESHNICSGYIPVAPVDTQNFSPESYQECQVQVAIVYGSNDKRLGHVSLQNLKNFAKRDIFCFEDAGHACYMNKPDEWHLTLEKVLNKLSA